MHYKKLTKKDFDWINWTVADIKKESKAVVDFHTKTIAAIKAVPKKERTFENTFYPLDTAAIYSDMRFSPIHFLGNSSTSASIRTAAVEAELKVSKAMRKMYRDKELYAALKEYKQNSEKLTDAEKLFVKDTLKGFKKMGLDLPEETQQQLLRLSDKMSEYSNAYRVHLNDYEDGILVTKEDLQDAPKDYVQSLRKKNGKYFVSLEYPDLGPFMKHVSNEKLRKKLIEKAHKQGGKKNLNYLQKLAELRLERAKLLGYTTHAEMVLEERMVKKPEVVEKFLSELKASITPAARKDLAILKKAKKQHLGSKAEAFGAWDTAFYINRLMKEKYDLDTEQLRQYFPLDHVLGTMLDHFGRLLGVDFVITEKISKIHKDVFWLEVKEKKQTIGYITLDFFPRKGKFTHMAMFDILPGYFDRADKKYHPPVVGMLGNFTKPVGKQQSLITLGEVETLFHEFGHLLHGVLTKAQLVSQSGVNVSWDFVEVPSQVIQQWAEETDFIAKFGKHHKTGEAVPKDILEKLEASKMFLRSFFEIRQNFQAQYDMAIHNVTKVPKDINAVFNTMYKKEVGLPMTKGAMYPAGFGHLAGGYDAGYYSYKWSEVYAIDIFNEFKKTSLFSKTLGKKYRKEILEMGSSRDEMESLKQFLGRKPNNKAFLKSIGIEK